MSRTFRGRAILPPDSGYPRNLQGEALVTHQGFNTYASFFSSIHVPSDEALCSDSSNRELFGKNLANKIICLPKNIGSTSGGAVWQRLTRMGNAPKAMLFSQQIDSLAAGGLIVADVWTGRRIVTIDQLGAEFLESVKDGDWIVIQEDGTVTIQ
jgi:predicted aconitase with swiveling domain